MMASVYLLFSPKGRINRAKYIVATLLWSAIGVGLVVLVYFITESFTSAAAWTWTVILTAPAVWSTIVVGIKRLHDRNKSGLWLLLFYLVPYMLDNGASSAELRGNSTAAIIAQVIELAITVWAFVELMCLRGTAGANQYGPDPLADNATPAASSATPSGHLGG